MSYDLRIWEQPAGRAAPASFEDTLRIWFEMELEARPGPHPKFTALAAQMAAYKGCGEAPWASDPVADAKGCTKAVWTFPLPEANRIQLLRVVAKLANALGLTVLDDQQGLALVPPDRVLPPERSGFWLETAQAVEEPAREAAAPLSLALQASRDEMRAALNALLLQHGFIAPRLALGLPYYRAQAEATYFRATPAGGQSVTLLSTTVNNAPCLAVDINIFSEEIASIQRAIFPEQDEMFFRRQMSFWVGIFQGVYAYVPVRTQAELQRMVNEVQDPIGPILEMTRTAPDLQAVMSGTPAFPLPAPKTPQAPKSLAEHVHQSAGYAALISAWLYGGKQFQAVAQYKRASDERTAAAAMKATAVQRVDRVLDYLQKNVQRKA